MGYGEKHIDPALLTWATPTERKYLEAINLHGGITAAAKALGIGHSALSRGMTALKFRASSRGYSPDHDMTKTVPEGFAVKGVSTYYDAEGQVRGQWVKSSRDAERHAELVKEFVEHLMAEARGGYPPMAAPAFTNKDLLSTYLFGDPHFGMRALKAEAGEDFDLAEADRLTRAGIDRLAAAMPDTEQALLIVIGDNTHANDSSHLTPEHKNPLDMDAGGHNRSMLISAKAWTYACKRLLVKHAKVTLWFMPGNHDGDAAFALALCLSMHFENEPRITVDLSPSLYRAMLFGRVLIGAHHGHGAKQADLPLLMAVDSAEAWGASIFRYIFMGHVHHDSVREIQGVRVESLRTLAAKDSYAARKGYRSMRDTRAIVHHKEFGEIERHTVSAAMLA